MSDPNAAGEVDKMDTESRDAGRASMTGTAGDRPEAPPDGRPETPERPAVRPGGQPEAGNPSGIGTDGREHWPVEPPSRPPNLMSPVALAYVGDAVYELLVRQHLAARPNPKPDDLHRGAIRYVSAKAQRALLEKLQPHLTEEEAEIVRRGRNAKSGSPPKGADMSDYRHATALECLFGWLYYAGRFERMAELLRMADGGPPADAGAAHRKEGDR